MKIIINIINKIPNILNKNYLDQLVDKFDNLIRMGFSKNEIVNIIKKNPYILLFPCDIIRDNHKYLLEYGFGNYSITLCPLLLSYNCLEIENRIKYYKKIKLFDTILDNPCYLLFNLDFIRIRYNFIIKKNGNLNDLFVDDILFYNKYNITRDKLIKGDI